MNDQGRNKIGKAFLLFLSLISIGGGCRGAEDRVFTLRDRLSKIDVNIAITKIDSMNMWEHEFLGKDGLSFSLFSRKKTIDGLLSFSPKMKFVAVNFDRSGKIEIYPIDDFLRGLIYGDCESVICYSKLKTRFNSKGEFIGTVRLAGLESIRWKDEATVVLGLFEMPEEDGIGPYGITINFRTGEAIGTIKNMNPAGYLTLNDGRFPIIWKK